MPRPKFRFQYNDGGVPIESKSNWDCVCRAIAIATGKPYTEVRDELMMTCGQAKKMYKNTLSKITLEEAREIFGDVVTEEKFELLKEIFKGDYSVDTGISGFIVICYFEFLGWERVMPDDIKCTHPSLQKGNYVLSYDVTNMNGVGHCVAIVDGVINDNNEVVAKQCFAKPVLCYWKKKDS